jgi:hypothetical protein
MLVMLDVYCIGDHMKIPSIAQSVTTLALGSRPRQGLAKVWTKSELGSHISCSWKCKRVVGVKTHWIEKLFISLENF